MDAGERIQWCWSRIDLIWCNYAYPVERYWTKRSLWTSVCPGKCLLTTEPGDTHTHPRLTPLLCLDLLDARVSAGLHWVSHAPTDAARLALPFPGDLPLVLWLSTLQPDASCLQNPTPDRHLRIPPSLQHGPSHCCLFQDPFLGLAGH